MGSCSVFASKNNAAPPFFMLNLMPAFSCALKAVSHSAFSSKETFVDDSSSTESMRESFARIGVVQAIREAVNAKIYLFILN